MTENVDPEILVLCGYIRVHKVIVARGQTTAFNLLNGWERLAVSKRSLGGQGCALPDSQEVTVWGHQSDESARDHWRYDVRVLYQGSDVDVFVSRIYEEESVTTGRTLLQSGDLVPLSPPTDLEVLAALANEVADEQVGEGEPGEDVQEEP